MIIYFIEMKEVVFCLILILCYYWYEIILNRYLQNKRHLFENLLFKVTPILTAFQEVK